MSDRLTNALAGVGVTPVTPFTSDLGSVDRRALADNLAFLLTGGVGLLYVAGNTGEVASLSPDEWVTVVETAVDVAGEAVVVAGVGHEYPVALELAKRAAAAGVDGILAMPRQQPYIASAGLVAYWEAIVEAAGLPAVVYQRGLPDSADLSRLLSHELVVGCKYAEPDVAGFAATVAADTSGVRWTCGIAERYAPFFATAGSVGFTSGLANVAPHLPLAMQDALDRGDLSGALSIRDACMPLEQIRARHGDSFNVSAVKAAMDVAGLVGGRVRPPLVDVDRDTAVEIETAVKALMTASEEYR